MMDPLSLLTGLLWNVEDLRLNIALHEIITYLDETEGELDKNVVYEIISDVMIFGHTHAFGEDSELGDPHSHGEIKMLSPEEVENLAALFHAQLNPEENEED